MKRLILYFIFFLLCVGCATTKEQVVKKDVQARLDLAQSYLLKGQPRLALIELKKIEKSAKYIPFYYFLKGMVYFNIKETKKAIECFKKAISLNPSYGDAYNNLGIVYLAEGDEKKAIECFQKALNIEVYATPEYPAHNLALIYKKKGDLDKAISFEKKAITENWRYLPSYISIADLYVKKGDINSAIFWLKKGIEAFPENLRLYFLLGENYLRLGKKKDAKKFFKRIIELDKEGKSSLTKMARDYLDLL